MTAHRISDSAAVKRAGSYRLSLTYPSLMCRSIVTLRRPDEPATDDEVRAAALQFVRKISGYRKPSRRNEEAFNAAVEEVAHSSRHLLEALNPPGRDAENAA